VRLVPVSRALGKIFSVLRRWVGTVNGLLSRVLHQPHESKLIHTMDFVMVISSVFEGHKPLTVPVSCSLRVFCMVLNARIVDDHEMATLGRTLNHGRSIIA
jgi:hypothetical protein